MQRVELIRLCELNVGDTFLLNGLEWKVYQIDELKIKCKTVSETNKNDFGKKNQQYVERIIPEKGNVLIPPKRKTPSIGKIYKLAIRRKGDYKTKLDL